MIPRKLSSKLVQLLKNRGEYNNVILLEGARQVGKTTLINNLLKETDIPNKTINLEKQRSFCEKIDRCGDFDEFTELIRFELKFKIGVDSILFIDEAQESRALGGFIRFMKEEWKSTQVILTGSSMARIFRDGVRFPVGRVTFLHLGPFSFTEFLTADDPTLTESLDKVWSTGRISPTLHNKLLDYLQQYMTVGGLPEVVTEYFNGRSHWKSLRNDILLGYHNDFKRIFGEEKQPYFIAAMEAVADLLGQPFKNSHVSRLLDGGRNDKIIESLSQLEAWKIIYKISQEGPSPTTDFHPKRYLFDLGIVRQLRESATPSIDLNKILSPATRTPLGGTIENMTMLSLIEDAPNLCGWKKSSSGSEVDFIVKWKESVIPFECKSSRQIKNSQLYGLRDYMNIYNVPVGVVISVAPFEIRDISKEQRIIILPLYLIEFWKDILTAHSYV